MLDCLDTDKTKNGYTAALHFRATPDLLPRLHAVARSRGLTAASFARAAIMEAVARAEHHPPA